MDLQTIGEANLLKGRHLEGSVRQLLSSDIIKRGYSDEEISHIYELARFSLETGQVRRAEIILNGLVEIAPDFAPALLALAYVHIQNGDLERAAYWARQALRIEPEQPAAMLYLIALLLTAKDYNSAGTYLGEIGEKIEAGAITDPNLVRFYRSQLARFNNR